MHAHEDLGISIIHSRGREHPVGKSLLRGLNEMTKTHLSDLRIQLVTEP